MSFSVWKNHETILIRNETGEIVIQASEAQELAKAIAAKWQYRGEKLEAARARMEHARQARITK